MTIARTLWFAGISLLAIGPAASAANVVIVRSTGPSSRAYPPGKALPDSAPIALQPGDMVTILGPNSARTLRGPGTFTAASATRNQLAMAAGRRSRFGAMRTGDVARNPSLLDLDATQSGKMCVNNPAKLSLWRPNSETAAKLNIRSKDGKVTSLDWPTGKATIGWPANLPVADAAEYAIEWEGTADKNDISFVVTPSPPTALVNAAQLLIDKGCQNQLDLLVDSAPKATTD